MVYLPRPASCLIQCLSTLEALRVEPLEEIVNVNSGIDSLQQQIRYAPAHGRFVQLLTCSLRIKNRVDAAFTSATFHLQFERKPFNVAAKSSKGKYASTGIALLVVRGRIFGAGAEEATPESLCGQ